MHDSDQQLVEKCRHGETAAFAVLVARYQTLVCSVAYSITGDFARSEDVGQEAFAAAWRQLSELADASRFKAWICSITRNLAHNAMRHERKLEFTVGQDEVADDSISPVEAAGQNEEQLLVWAALSRLPENYREPLVLFYRQDQSVNEVARSLDVTVDVAKQRLSRGRKLLREEVLSTLERTLKRTTPTRAFTIAVIASLPAMATATATAAAAGGTATIAKAAIGAGGAKAGGVLGALFGGLVGLGGAAFGTWASWTTAEYQKQRDLIRHGTIAYLIGMAIFSVPFVAMIFGWRPQRTLGTNGYLIFYGAWMTFFMTANFIWMFWLQRAWHRITRQERSAGATMLPETRARRWISKWEGRRWQSRRKLLGLALVDVSFSAPGASWTVPNSAQQGRARGWIALGDHSRGRLFAFGNVAIAPIAVGTMSFGIVSFGVLSVGLLSLGVVTLAVMSLGVLAFGVWSIGAAVAIGYLAAGPVAIAWQAAYGAVAIAFEYAGGSKAIANHAGDGAASRYFANSPFFVFAGAVIDTIVAATRSRLWLWMLVIVVVTASILLEAMYRRKPAG
jgi:RNA polymerase sigma factor (sigma-70 family)